MTAKNILFITHTYPPKWDGVSRSVFELHQIFMLEKAYSTRILCTNYKIKNYRFASNIISNFRALISINDFPIITTGVLKIFRHIKWSDVIICCEGASLSTYAIFWGKILKKRIINWRHVNIEDMSLISIENKFLAKLANYISNFHYKLLNRLSDNIVLNGKIDSSSNKSITILPAINKLKFFSDNLTGLKKNMEFSNKKAVVCFVGRLSPEKGVHELINIVSDLQLLRNCSFIVVGDGNYSKFFEENHRIKYIKRTDDIYNIYKESDIILVLSKTETGPLVLLEAMASGLIPITTDVGIASDLIKENINGCIVDRNSSNFVENVILKINYLIKDKNLMSRIQKSNIDKAKADFLDWNDVYNLFTRLIDNK